MTYHVVMQRDDGEIIEADFETLWSPEKVTLESVADACAAQCSGLSKRKHVGISAEVV